MALRPHSEAPPLHRRHRPRSKGSAGWTATEQSVTHARHSRRKREPRKQKRQQKQISRLTSWLVGRGTRYPPLINRRKLRRKRLKMVLRFAFRLWGPDATVLTARRDGAASRVGGGRSGGTGSVDSGT